MRYFLLLLTLIFLSCQMNKKQNSISWHMPSTLPAENGQDHIGVAGPTTGILNNTLIIAGGANFPSAMPWDGGQKAYQKEVYLYDISTNGELTFRSKQFFGDSIAYAANVSVGNQLYTAGGEREGKAIADVFIYRLENNELQRKSLSNLPQPLTNASITFLKDKLYVVGGENSENVSNSIYELDVKDKAARWKEVATLPKPLSHAVVLTDGLDNLFVLGGRKRNLNSKSDIYSEVYQITLANLEIKQLPSIPDQLAAGTGVFYQDRIYLFGGDNGATFHQVEKLIGQINLSSDGHDKEQLIAKKNHIQQNHPGFGKHVWVFDLKSKNWELANDIVGQSPVTTTAILYENKVIIPSGEVKAGVRTNQILLGEIK